MIVSPILMQTKYMDHTRCVQHRNSRKSSHSMLIGYFQNHFEALKAAYPGRRLLVVSNTAGASSWDKNMNLAAEVEKNTEIPVLPHSVKKPGCGSEIMDYFRRHPETGVTHPSQIAVVGDRLTTDMMLANMMGGWGFWIKDGVVPLQEKNIVSAREDRRWKRC